MSTTIEIHPKIGIARLGNSPKEFYLGPETIGGLPLEWDENNHEIATATVSQYKDSVGRLKRQAACFKIYAYDNSLATDSPKEITVDSYIPGSTTIKVVDIQWTVHLANKKASWYTFSELQGDLMFGGQYDQKNQTYDFNYDASTNLNSYQNQNVGLNNPTVKSDDRYTLIVDPGPRTVNSANKGFDNGVEFSKYNIPGNQRNPNYSPSQTPFGQTSLSNYKKYSDSCATAGNFPVPEESSEITTLGRIFTDKNGRLIALGGMGAVQSGTAEITTFRGAAGYYDDISDGYVIATLKLSDGTYIDLEPAWLIVGSPKVAPELINIITMDDILFDVAIRHQQLCTDIYDSAGSCADNAFKIIPPSSLPNELLPIVESLNKTLPVIFKNFNPNYKPDYVRDILPIIERPQSYRWVANVPSMIEFANPGFDTSKIPHSSDANYDRELANLLEYFLWFRVPVPPEYYNLLIGNVPENEARLPNGPNQLFFTDDKGNAVPQLPLMPLNSGDNTIVNDGPIYKFQALSLTQYFFLYQWAMGKFTCTLCDDSPRADFGSIPPSSTPAFSYDNSKSHLEAIDRGVVGNCVGAPNAPGIEVTWTIRNPNLYRAPYQIAVDFYNYQQYSSSPYTDSADSVNQTFIDNYNANGLAYQTPPRDECEAPENQESGELNRRGCQPGDLTKRMAIPWQADFFNCTVQTPSIIEPMYNQDDTTSLQAPPTYYVYWWPPQSPYNTFIGLSDIASGNLQVLEAFITRNSMPAGAPTVTGSGQQVLYHRGINSFNDTIVQWTSLGFIVNQGTTNYPYYVEVERNTNQIAQSLLNNESVDVNSSLRNS